MCPPAPTAAHPLSRSAQQGGGAQGGGAHRQGCAHVEWQALRNTLTGVACMVGWGVATLPQQRGSSRVQVAPPTVHSPLLPPRPRHQTCSRATKGWLSCTRVPTAQTWWWWGWVAPQLGPCHPVARLTTHQPPLHHHHHPTTNILYTPPPPPPSHTHTINPPFPASC